MTRRLMLGVLLVGVSAFAWPRIASAQGKSKTATGTVTAVAADSLTVNVKGTSMTFAVSHRTVVVEHGVREKNKPKLTDIVKDGQSVRVTYKESDGAMQASRVQVVTEPKGTSKSK
jgi:uncharacterized protein DUF5666